VEWGTVMHEGARMGDVTFYHKSCAAMALKSLSRNGFMRRHGHFLGIIGFFHRVGLCGNRVRLAGKVVPDGNIAVP
jgi:hypothetical protein